MKIDINKLSRQALIRIVKYYDYEAGKRCETATKEEIKLWIPENISEYENRYKT